MGISKKYTKKQIENLLRHLIIQNVAILSSLEASKNELRLKKLPLWVQDPVKDMFVELIQDLMDALAPALEIAEKEYTGRPDRLLIIKACKDRLDARKSSQAGYEECHCAGCQDE